MLRHPSPWKTSKSPIKAYVVGSAIAGWICGAAMVPACALTGNSGLLVLGIIYAMIGALATYLWFHG
jgi:hypothetical protein